MTLACSKRSFGGGASQNEDKCQKKKQNTKQNRTEQNKKQKRNSYPRFIFCSVPGLILPDYTNWILLANDAFEK